MSAVLSAKAVNSVERSAVLVEADRLFYSAGVGVTTLRDVARASGLTVGKLSKLYPSKESLIVAYLRKRHEDDVQTLDSLRASELLPAEILEQALQGIIADLLSPQFRGCAFLNAAAETGTGFPEVAREVHDHRDWYAEQTTELLRTAGHPYPADAADDLLLARDGGMASIHGGNLVSAVGAMRRAIQRAIDEIG